MGDLSASIDCAAEAHITQLDQSGEPYVAHVIRVTARVPVPAMCVAVLHDVIEDSHMDAAVVAERCALSDVEHDALRTVTRWPGENYAEYIERVRTAEGMAGAIARVVKRADLRDNLRPRNDGRDLSKRYIAALAKLELQRNADDDMLHDSALQHMIR